jgi:hypothetical protein
MIGKMPDVRWGVIGSFNTEDRCSATLSSLAADRVHHRRFLRILDPDMPITEPFAKRQAAMRRALVEAGCDDDAFVDARLLAPIDVMRAQLDGFLEASGENVILDITAMPKRWFFLLVKLLSRNAGVRNLLATYASAESYGRTLSSNPEPLRALPGFGSDDARLEHETAIVGVGFEPLGLNDLYSQHKIDKVRYLFPFPPGPPGFHRNWRFVRSLERLILNRDAVQDDRWHIDMYDCSATFEALLKVTRNGEATSVLAPYGPKTTSLAMCLFANAVEVAGHPQVPVYYAQPKRYDIGYSTGVKTVGGRADIQSYCIKIDGRTLYGVN